MFNQSVVKPELAQPIRYLIQNTWTIHSHEENETLPLIEFLSFFENFSDSIQEKLNARGMIQLIKTDHHTGTFINEGSETEFKLQINGEQFTIYIPEILKGIYSTKPNNCFYSFHRTTTIIGSKRIPFFSSPIKVHLEKLIAGEEQLHLSFEGLLKNFYLNF